MSQSNPNLALVYPISFTVSLTNFGISTYADVLISPATNTNPVVTVVSHATLDFGSASNNASSIESDIWSQILSGCPSVTDSDVNKCLAILSFLPFPLNYLFILRHLPIMDFSNFLFIIFMLVIVFTLICKEFL